MSKLTVRTLQTMKAGAWRTDGGARGAGTLAARRLTGIGRHVLFYYRYTNSRGSRDVVPLGQWCGADGKGAGLSLEDARARAGELANRYTGGGRDLREAIDAEQREAERLRGAAIREAEAEAATKRATLGALLTGYVDQLERDGKASAVEVRRALRRHVHDAWPVLWSTPAERITPDDLLSVVALPADAAKLREAAKLRAYLRAAYAAAVRARHDARALPALRELKLAVNPARDLVTIEGASQARERALSVAELRAYWRRIEALPDPGGALLRFHLLTGGQRIEQLGRVTVADFDPDLSTVRLRDGKGRRRQARLHDVPLIPLALDALRAMQGGALGSHLFTVTAGESGAVYATVQHRLRAVADAMAEAGELPNGPFTVGDLRRTVETRLAAEGVGVEVRAQLQSHGLSGVQARHYDRHDYLAEKRDALETLHRLLTNVSAKVTPIRKRRA
ncbi:hypothetical protein [Lysobacter sp. P5_B9]